jgi:geranylgeranyl transferase type-2 subunit beta
MGHKDALDREEMIRYVLSCWDDEAGELSCHSRGESSAEIDTGTFGAHPGHDGHLLGTLSGIQILVMQDALNRADVESILKCK